MKVTGTGLFIGVIIGVLMIRYWQRNNPTALGDTLFYANVMDDPEHYAC